MPRVKKKVAKKTTKKKKRKKQEYPLLGVASGQKGLLRIGDSQLAVTRTPDKVILRRMPKKQKLIRE